MQDGRRIISEIEKWLGLAISTLVVFPLATGSLAQDKPLKKVGLAVGTTVLNVGYPMVTLPVTLGYWKQEGYDVDVQPVGASLQAIQQMVAGNADFAEVNASAIVQSNVKNNLPVRVVMDNGVIDWALAVDADGPIKSIKDIKGKTIGVFSLATGGIAYLNTYLRANGLDPGKDVDLVPLGLGAPPVEALRSGKVQGLLYWAAAISTFENTGLKLRKLMGEDWRTYPDYSMSTMQATIDKDPAMVIAIARGAAKASVFALANPDCALKLHWAKYPSTRPSGADEATLVRWDLNNQRAQLEFDAGRLQAQRRQGVGPYRSGGVQSSDRVPGGGKADRQDHASQGLDRGHSGLLRQGQRFRRQGDRSERQGL